MLDGEETLTASSVSSEKGDSSYSPMSVPTHQGELLNDIGHDAAYVGSFECALLPRLATPATILSVVTCDISHASHSSSQRNLSLRS
jgi:hypothetical protein